MSARKGTSELPEQPARWLCDECGDVFGDDDLLTAKSPFSENDTITGCPSCFSVNSMMAACWKCDKPASMGVPLTQQYRYVHSCHDHRPPDAIWYRGGKRSA